MRIRRPHAFYRGPGNSLVLIWLTLLLILTQANGQADPSPSLVVLFGAETPFTLSGVRLEDTGKACDFDLAAGVPAKESGYWKAVKVRIHYDVLPGSQRTFELRGTWLDSQSATTLERVLVEKKEQAPEEDWYKVGVNLLLSTFYTEDMPDGVMIDEEIPQSFVKYKPPFCGVTFRETTLNDAQLRARYRLKGNPVLVAGNPAVDAHWFGIRNDKGLTKSKSQSLSHKDLAVVFFPAPEEYFDEIQVFDAKTTRLVLTVPRKSTKE